MSAALILAQNGFDGHMDWDGGWWVLMILGMILFWGLVIAAIVWIARESRGRWDRHEADASGTDPAAVLDRRLAEGSITIDDYRERRAILGGEPPPR